MTTPNFDFLASLGDALERKGRGNWSEVTSEAKLSRAEAVQKVATVFRQQLLDPLPNKGPGSDFVVGLFAVSDFFSSLHPTDEEIARVIKLAADNYYAFVSLDLISQLSIVGESRLLADWKRKKYLGVFVVPDRPKGPSPYKSAHRKMLIVSQIRNLQASGFSPQGMMRLLCELAAATSSSTPSRLFKLPRHTLL